MRKNNDVGIVIQWNEGSGPDAVPGNPDKALLLELARELGRLAARRDMDKARAAREAVIKGEAQPAEQHEADGSPQPTQRRGRRGKKTGGDPI